MFFLKLKQEKRLVLKLKHETISFMYFQFNDDHYNFQDKKIGYVRFAKKP